MWEHHYWLFGLPNPALYFWSHDHRWLCLRSRVLQWSRSGIRDCLCLHSGLFVVILVPLRWDEVSFECKKILKIESAFLLCHHICNYKADGNGKMSPGPRAARCTGVLVFVTQHKQKCNSTGLANIRLGKCFTLSFVTLLLSRWIFSHSLNLVHCQV